MVGKERIKDEARRLVYYEDARKTGAVIAAGTALYAALVRSGMTLLALGANAGMLAILVTAAWSYGAWMVPAIPEPPEMPQAELTEERVRELVDGALPPLNRALAFFNRLRSLQDPREAGLTFAALMAVSVLGKAFSLLTLAYLLFLAAITLPFLYHRHKSQIDSLLHSASSRLHRLSSRLHSKFLEKIPKAQATQQKSKKSE